MLVAPIFGGLFYLTFKPFSQRRKIRKTVIQLDNIRKESLLPYFKELPQLPARYQKQITRLKAKVGLILLIQISPFTFRRKINESYRRVEKLKEHLLHYFILDEKVKFGIISYLS